MTAATGAAIGLGQIGLAFLSVVLTWVVLAIVGWLEGRMGQGPRASAVRR